MQTLDETELLKFVANLNKWIRSNEQVITRAVYTRKDNLDEDCSKVISQFELIQQVKSALHKKSLFGQETDFSQKNLEEKQFWGHMKLLNTLLKALDNSSSSSAKNIIQSIFNDVCSQLFKDQAEVKQVAVQLREDANFAKLASVLEHVRTEIIFESNQRSP